MSEHARSAEFLNKEMGADMRYCMLHLHYASASSFDIADLSDKEDSAAHLKFRRKAKPAPSAAMSKPGRLVQLSATDTAKSAMAVQEPQLLDKMENVAYRLNTQAEERKKRMNSRYPYYLTFHTASRGCRLLRQHSINITLPCVDTFLCNPLEVLPAVHTLFPLAGGVTAIWFHCSAGACLVRTRMP